MESFDILFPIECSDPLKWNTVSVRMVGFVLI